MNKKYIIIISIIMLILLAIILPLSLNHNHTEIDLDSLERTLKKQFIELNLKRLEKDEISDYFGILISDESDALFMIDYHEEDALKPFSPNVLIVIIKDKDYDQYLSTLKDYLDVEINNTIDQERIKLYQSATIKTSRDYFYLVIGSDKNIIKTIDNVLSEK